MTDCKHCANCYLPCTTTDNAIIAYALCDAYGVCDDYPAQLPAVVEFETGHTCRRFKPSTVSMFDRCPPAFIGEVPSP